MSAVHRSLNGATRRLDGQVAIVTGAATGLGRAIAEAYAAAGARVVVADVRAGEGEATAQAIRDDGGEASFAEVDVTDADAVAGVVAMAEERYGALNIMTANAGILGRAYGKAFVDIADDDFADLMRVNFDGVRLCFKHAIPALRRAGGGSMTASTSLAAHRGYVNLAAYSSSKGAVLALVRALATELAPDIRVNTVSPGAMGTDMVAHAVETGAESAAEGPGRPKALRFRTLGDTSEVAAAHLFLVSRDASFITGQALIVDGGRSIASAGS